MMNAQHSREVMAENYAVTLMDMSARCLSGRMDFVELRTLSQLLWAKAAGAGIDDAVRAIIERNHPYTIGAGYNAGAEQ